MHQQMAQPPSYQPTLDAGMTPMMMDPNLGQPPSFNQQPKPVMIGAPEEEEEKYCGPKSCCCFLMGFWCIMFCPIDKRPK